MPTGELLTGERLDLPAMEVASLAGGDAAVEVMRAGRNDWALSLLAGGGDGAAHDLVRTAARAQFEPARALTAVAPLRPQLRVGLVRVELDICGAWLTLCTAGIPQAVVLRAAGWLDFRGHLSGSLGAADLTDDRVGLGPGDALVLLSPAVAQVRGGDGELVTDEVLPAALLAGCGLSAADALAGLRSAVNSFGAAPAAVTMLVVRVPPDAKDDSVRRVGEATGLSPAELKATRYPLGEQLMRERPQPPREARMRVPAELSQVREVRQLLRRLLSSWRMDELNGGDIELLASELTANAIAHGQSPVTLIAKYDGRCVRVEVGDGSRELPTVRQADAEAESGRGIAFVQELSSAWGTVSTLEGKRVWFEVPAAS